jgi:membrane-bound lytic murein transglycosylase D
MDMDDFNRYNPDFDRVMASANNTYDLKLPADKMDLFIANKYQILNESVQFLLNGVSESDSSIEKISTVAVAKRDRK